MSVELKPCPFCGSQKIKFVGTHRPYWSCRCEGCGADGGLCHTKTQAHDCWNTRAELDRKGEEG